MIPFMNEDEQQILGAQYMLDEKISSDTKISSHKVNDSGGNSPVKGDVPYKFEYLGDPLGATAAGSPVAKHLIACNGADKKRGCLLQIVIPQRLFNLLYLPGQKIHDCLLE